MKARGFLFLFSILISFLVRGQETSYTVLVVPFERFEFHTEMNLEEINKINKVSGDEFYTRLISSLQRAFETNTKGDVKYKFIDKQKAIEWQKLVKYDLDVGKGHYYSDITAIPDDEFKSVLAENECDLVLFINWYRILQKKESARVEKVKKYMFYAWHFIDYDIYTEKKKLFLFDSRVEFKVKATADNIKRRGLYLDDLSVPFSELAEGISLKILEPK